MITVRGAIVLARDDRGRVLFVRQTRGPFAGHWLFPGGALEPGETPLDGAQREAREESGCELGAAELVAVYDVRSQPEGAFHFITHLYRGTLVGDPVAEPGSEARWLDPRELPLHPALTAAGVRRTSDRR